jgi:8-oxo-dGTP pyrophosphatase MutT (NUDIX family)
VEEETGLVCELGDELPSTTYTDAEGRVKLVRWWEMTPVDDRGFEPGDEIDELRWLAAEDARAVLSYDHDRELV